MDASGPRLIKILIADDEPGLRQSVKQALLTDGRRIDLAASGEEALRLEAENVYDVIVADLMMPGLSGLDLLRTLKERGSRARLILISGYPTIAAAGQAVRMGAFEFLAKPFMPDEIRVLVERALSAAPAAVDPKSGCDLSG
jgi:two-component system response regulator HydG